MSERTWLKLATEHAPEPVEVIHQVDAFIDAEHRDAAKYENRTPLDASGALTLHLIAGEIYAAGFRAGENAAGLRHLAATARTNGRR